MKRVIRRVDVGLIAPARLSNVDIEMRFKAIQVA